MATFTFLLVLILTLMFTGHNAILWSNSSPEDGATIIVCDGNDVTLDWNFTTETGDDIIDVQWYFQADGGQEEAIAGLIHSHFFTDLDRLEHVPLGGLKVKGVKAGHVGVYSVHVNYRNSSGFFVHTSSVRLQTAEAPVITGGHLTMQRTPGVVKDQNTGEWTAQLECGHFQNLGNPPVTVEWTTPSGDTFNSTQFHNGTFFVNVIPKVNETGSYHCAIANTSDVISCLNAHDQHALLRPASLAVDAKNIQMEILVAENEELKHNLENVTSQLQYCQSLYTCRDGWTRFQTSCYKHFDSESVEYPQAKSQCEAHNGMLAEITSAQENSFVMNTLLAEKGGSAFIGITDTIQEGHWVLPSSGAPTTYFHWYAAQPDNTNHDEDCVTISGPVGNFPSGWNDVPCHGYIEPFICEYSLLSAWL